MDELYNANLLERLSGMIDNAQQSQSPSMANPQEGLASINIQTPNEQISEEQVYEGSPAEGLSEMSTQTIQKPQRREFEISPDIIKISAAMDYLSGQPMGTTMNQMINQYKNTVAAADEAAIGDFERERAYQDTRADKAKAEEKAERAYRDARTDKEREYIDKRLEGLQVPASNAKTATAQKNVANEARNLAPERFTGMSDEDIIERLASGISTQKKSGKDYDKEFELEALKHKFRMEENAQKAANKAVKDAGKMGDAEKELMKKEAANIGKEVDKLQEENRKIQDFQSVYDKNMERLNILEEASKNIDNLLDRAGAAIGPAGVGKAAVLFDDDIAAALEEIKSLATQVNTAMMSFIKEDGATGKMMDTEKEQLKLLGTISDLPSKIGWGTTEQTVKESILSGIKRYRDKIQEYNAKIKSMNKNYKNNENRLNTMQSDFDTKYGLNKTKKSSNKKDSLGIL